MSRARRTTRVTPARPSEAEVERLTREAIELSGGAETAAVALNVGSNGAKGPAQEPTHADNRTEDLESRIIAAESMTRLVPNLFTRIEMAEQQIVAMGKLRDMQQISIERQTRHSALDLAIKAAPSLQSSELLELAQNILAWLRAGTN